MSVVTMTGWARRCVLLLALLSITTTALQVTPNSPCASLCQTSTTAPSGKPFIRDDEIVCANRDFAGAAGVKFKGCMSCLENSTYSDGAQNDQAWFMYNLQYAFAHCVFGYPNGTGGIGPYPCMTSEACGPLKTTVTSNLANSTGSDPFGYCRYKGGSNFGGTFGKCLDCMKPDSEHGYLANYFVALEAGCEQRPTSNGRLGLNATIFSNRTISIVDPNKPAKADNQGLSTGALIAVVVVCVVVGLLLISAGVFFYIRHRRRNRYNQSALEHAAKQHMRGGGGGHGPSSMDFQCASSHVNPFTPGVGNNNNNGSNNSSNSTRVCDDPSGSVAEIDAARAVNFRQQCQYADEKAMAVAAYAAAAREQQKQQQHTDGVDALRSHPPTGPVRNFSHKQQQQPFDINTAADVAQPEKAATSSSTPYSPDSFVTPSSATSATPFLAAGQKSAYSPPMPQQPWEETRAPSRGGGGGGGGGILRSKGSKPDVNAPVAARQLQMKFPPPPKQ